MTAHQFQLLVQEAVEALPLEFRRRLTNVLFIVREEAPEAGLLGQQEGTPLTEKTVLGQDPRPAKITIFQSAHEEAASSWRHLRQMVFETVAHEVGHYFGMDEERVQRWERRRRTF
jgi:predicted Zn-dependent protease with MMP-like domain